ncbi:hypothetical protein P152DRAFT_454781 [Eremomyces bilateralis CBS 781.70]|uniref:LysM domain-containing protein n=1 Tax=Eremomyces bilateralis CBS 781.70 TaxID=1392243 RepID=A0A6G1GEM1_9PEZI|nr:uncharacterized protein P152DRAFT_454781 [Eremomyces bilateralis CBS 781.70]KAF1816527.1 hypothetical protein P152DRAFT_454781 [Eremomyces bilateralis CBS 781.70]
MGRWTDRESDDQRLPDGMQRVGYDADTQRHTFQSSNGALFQGPAGARYGRLTPYGSEPRPMTMEEDEAMKEGNREAWRYLLPFLLLVVLVLFLLFKLVNTGPGSTPEPPLRCADGSHAYVVQRGDTCWEIVQRAGVGLQDLMEVNPGMECDRLRVGKAICVPDGR